MILLRSPTKDVETISFHIASKRHYFIVAALLLTITGGVFYSFLIFWLLPTYMLPMVTYYIIRSAFIGQLLVAWMPASVQSVSSVAHRLHTVGGIWVGTATILCIWIVALYGQGMQPIGYAATLLTTVIGTLSYTMLLLGLWRYKKLILINEIIIIGLFSITLILLAAQI